MTSANDFSCEGKCRLCPYPGANCKTIVRRPGVPDRSSEKPEIAVDSELQDQFLRKMHVK